SEIPVSRLEGVLGTLAKNNPEIGGEIQKASQRNLGQSDTAIVFPAGADLALVLDKPLAVERIFPPAVPGQFDSNVTAAVEQMLTEAPHRAESKDGKPGDPLNLVVIGSAGQIQKAFVAAGWLAAEVKNEKSIMRTVRAIAGDEGYGSAPVSQLYVYGRQEDLAFEKMLNTFTKRHHLRLWRTSKTTPEGREIWLGAATHDTGIDIHPGVVSHAIDPDLDAERSKVGADLEFTGLVSGEQLLTRSEPLSQGLTATGGTWKTDGRLLGIELKPGG
ncbi:MAG TPA: LssY C-terminal domain-containing protein, partial [Terriglobia bacterium]|nr:LssY C-terminal domain-containing protein [Terriglobia bacterium]